MNETGIIPLGYKILVKLEEKESKTKGGIIIPESTLDLENNASQIATVLDFGEAAFTIGMADLPNEWNVKPKVGSKVLLNKYAGIRVEGKDGKEYRIINDKEILAIYE